MKHPHRRFSVLLYMLLSALTAGCYTEAVQADEVPAGLAGYKLTVKPFFDTHCVRCHGPDKNKGGITVHSMHGDLSLGQELEHWESILDMLKFGEMPPIDEPQPKPAEVKAVMKWIESGMRDYVNKVSQEQVEAKTRRLTNVEYQNTLNELLGFDLDVIEDLPEDPELHYGFNNTADLMRMGPEQLKRYLLIARQAMRSAIVDPGKPEVFKVRREWQPIGINMGRVGEDEVGIWQGGGRHGAAKGLGFQKFPVHGEYRLRIKASAILPPGFTEVPLKIDMGAPPEHTETPHKTAGVLYLTNTPDKPEVFEMRGRIENHPSAPPRGRRALQGNEMVIIPRLFYDDGTLNDGGFRAFDRNMSMPRAVVSWIELEVPVVDVWPPKYHTDILFDSPLRESDENAYIRQVIQRFISRAYRRPATTPEVDKFTKIYQLIRPDVETLEEGVRETLAMVLISPQFLYHTESDPAADAHYAMASRLSYFLWASMPDEHLFKLAADQKLNDPKVIEQQVLRMLEDDRSGGFIEDFTLQWLSIRKMLMVPINKDLYPRFLYLVWQGETAGIEKPYRINVRDFMMQETVGFVGELIKQNRSAFDLIDSDFAYLNERLAAHYGIEGVRGMKMRPVPIKPEDNLGGLLTHGSVLIGNGTGTAPHPIYRAVWLREAILGDHVAPPPSEVPALEETAGDTTEGALSIAQLLAKHRTVESCNDCHFRLDPWGIPFEDYNAIGQYQPRVPEDGTRVSHFNKKVHGDLAGYQEYRESINTVEVDAMARVPHGPEIDGMRELKAYLLKERKDDIGENIIRRLLSYSIGRELTYRDRFEVQDLFDEAKDSDFKMRDIIVTICKSDVFRDASPTKEE